MTENSDNGLKTLLLILAAVLLVGSIGFIAVVQTGSMSGYTITTFGWWSSILSIVVGVILLAWAAVLYHNNSEDPTKIIVSGPVTDSNTTATVTTPEVQELK